MKLKTIRTLDLPLWPLGVILAFVTKPHVEKWWEDKSQQSDGAGTNQVENTENKL